MLKRCMVALLFVTLCSCAGGDIMSKAKVGDVTGIKASLDKGVSIDSKYKKSRMTVLMVAANNNRVEAVEYLCEQGANVDARSWDGSTALHYATFYNFERVVKVLLKYNAEREIKDRKGYTPLDYAKENEYTRIMKLLEYEGAPQSQAQIEPVDKNADLITINLLDNAYHMGDDNVSRFTNIKPQGEVFVSKFNITDSKPSIIFVTISVSDMVPKNHKQFLKGNYQTKLVINGSEIAILNNYISGVKDKKIVEHIKIGIDKDIVKMGYNEIKIIGGYRQDNTNYDDFQIHKVIVRYK